MIHYYPSTGKGMPHLSHVISRPRVIPLPIVQCSLPPPVRSCKSFTLDNVRDSKGMTWYHEMKFKVRTYELDQYGVVNNAVYANYCEIGHRELFDTIGLDAYALAISETSVKYIAPLRAEDKFVVKVRIYKFSAARLFYEDLIFKLPNEEPILEAKTTLVCLDKNYRPTRITAGMISKFNQFLLVSQTGTSEYQEA